MTRYSEIPILRRDDGSIDVEHYLTVTRELRSEMFATNLRLVRRTRQEWMHRRSSRF
jgi:hypothetical protein